MRQIRMKGYEAFRCLADRCPFTCCQQWKIAVDGGTEERWAADGLSGHVMKKEGARVIRLNEKGLCPFLTEDRLCRLVIEGGEETIPETCREFPRQVHRFPGRTEYALVACCPEVVEQMRQGEPLLDPQQLSIEAEDFVTALRNWMIAQVQDVRYTTEMNLKMIFYVLRDLYDREADAVLALQECLPVLPELSDAIAGLESVPLDTLAEVNELFLDMSQNYRKEGLYKEYLEPMCQAAEVLLDSKPADLDIKRLLFQEKMISYDPMLRQYLTCELFANSLLPESSLEDLIVMVQWIVMEYALVRHGIFLDWLENGCGELVWERIRDRVVVLARMTGYDLEDIYEYLTNSFDEVIWEWGYLALLIG
jgi:lysine-N-methylase